MRYFYGKNTPESWCDKFNWIDENNVFVGFDAEQSCCERFGWYLSSSDAPLVDPPTADAEFDFGPYTFDPSFFHDCGTCPQVDEGGEVSFRLVHGGGGDDLYLHLFNSHNGYYAHGFATNVTAAELGRDEKGCI